MEYQKKTKNARRNGKHRKILTLKPKKVKNESEETSERILEENTKENPEKRDWVETYCAWYYKGKDGSTYSIAKPYWESLNAP